MDFYSHNAIKSEQTSQIYIVKRIRLTMNKLIFALLTVGAIATAAVPANAQNIGNVQTSDQNSVITGNDNVTNQRVNQTGEINQRNNRRNPADSGVPGDSANIQTTGQNSDVLGDGNLTNQRTTQKYKENRTEGGRGQRRY